MSLATAPRYAMSAYNAYQNMGGIKNFSRYGRYAQAAWNNRSVLQPIAKYGRSSMNNRRRTNNRSARISSARRSGFNVKRSNTAFRTHQNNDLAIRVKTLGRRDVQFPTTGGGRNKRSKSLVNCKGFKLCYDFYNDNSYPVEVHWAVVRLRCPESTELTTSNPDFFNGQDGSSGLSFDNDEVSPTFDSRYKCCPLNPSKYHILTRQHRILGGRETKNVETDGTTTTTTFTGLSIGQSPWYWKKHEYFDVKKSIEFDGASDQTPRQPFEVYYWWQPVDPNDYTSNTTGVRFQRSDVVYFDEN